MAKFDHHFEPSSGRHEDHEAFLSALSSQHIVELKFFSKEDGGELVRSCAPMDFGPSRRTSESSNRYHFWDYDSDTSMHTLSLLPDQVRSIRHTDASFDPAEFVKWDPDWYTSREWGLLS